MRVVTALSVLAVAVASALPAQAAPTGPDDFLGAPGTSTMHGDAASSDTTPLAGPGASPQQVTVLPLGAACSTVLETSDGLVVALCTAIAGRAPTVYLLDPEQMRGGPLAAPTAELARMPLAVGGLLGGVYAYLDDADRLVIVDGTRTLLRIGHHRDDDGWRLSVDEATDLRGAIPDGDSVSGLVPDTTGNVWFATAGGVAGYVARDGGARTRLLGEGVANSISASSHGVAVATTHALYQLDTGEDGSVVVDWRAPYDRGSARKPGQLSWGTGSTPTYFGPDSRYLTIVDNADEKWATDQQAEYAVSLQVFDSESGEPVCTTPVLTEGGPGSENSPIAYGDTVIVASTHGYPYPAMPADAGPSVPESAPFRGGATRVRVGNGVCGVEWNSPLRSSAVPHVSLADGLLYTVTRRGADTTSPIDGFDFTVVDPETGHTIGATPLPGTTAHDTLQMSGLITTGGDYLQGTVTGIVRVGP
ncbi:hypothetical protein HCA44_11520 [Rhodococcus sp. HNM0569]|nr:hypothetical protein [Rhodococcus sp. HNM0569]